MTSDTSLSQHTLLISAPDEKGLVYRISKVIVDHGLNITSNGEYVDAETGQFFIRCGVEGELDRIQMVEDLNAVLPAGSVIDVREKKKKKVLIMGTREYHCLADLLAKHHYGDINAEILAVVSNHDHLRNLVEKFELPYHSISTKGLDRAGHEEKVLNLLKQFDFDYLILAKYMRILTPHFVDTYKNRIINIHHSFLPAFMGANPYGQAHDRGVKIIGATAHYVTDDLDEGPIIHQSITHVDHHFTPKGMARAGRDVERSVLGKALELVFNDRVMINGNKTIIF